MTPSIELAGVGKRYTKLTDRVVGGGLRRTRREEFWALRGVDLVVPQGECVGVVGRNGSGKSTLLTMLAGVSAPSEGRLTVRGRVAPLLSVGVGFHQELTGRENVFVNGVVLGMSRSTVEQRLDEIVAFADIESFLDTPVKFYSSGMFVRLGFAVAVSSRPDVLLVDEVLAVGDLAFQVKCFDRIRELQRSGTTVVVVTHNLQAMEMLCDRGVVVDGGMLRFDGGVHAAVGYYHRLLTEELMADVSPAATSRVLAVELLHPSGEPAATVGSGACVRVRIEVARGPDDLDPVIELAIANDRADVYRETLAWSDLRLGDRTGAVVEASLRLPLTTGTYSLRAAIAREGSAVSEDDTVPPTFFRVTMERPVNGVVDLAATYTITGDR